ncbi:MAG: Holliday junction resolvase [Treponema sp.]|nr:Holliday junction resolvase [Treponema sp.]
MNIKEFFSNPLVLAFAIVFLLLVLVIQQIRFHIKLKNIRKDTLKRSKAVRGGQTAEQFAPFNENFPCNPADAKFLGKPVDYVAFKGLEESDKVEEILLIEIKTGESKLSSREKEIKKAVQEGRFRYVELKL